MRVDQIEIHAGAVDFEFTPVRRLEAKCEAKTAFSKTPTMADVNLKLQEMASQIGANAVVEVHYDSGMSMTSWRSMKATGLAVKRVADEIPCPVCAEMIKRAAAKCRFCGASLGTATAPAASAPATETTGQPWTTQATAATPRPRSPAPASQLSEPLKSTDNPQTVIWIIAAVVVVLVIIVAANS
jgi:hypothetical protein